MINLLDLLFTETPNGLVEANKEAKLIESIRTLLVRDVGIVIDGVRVKEIARKELSYIYFVCKKEFYEGLDGDERKKVIKERVALPNKWTEDKVILDVIEHLKTYSVSIEEKLLISAKQNLEDYLVLFHETGEYSRKLIKQLQLVPATALEINERKEAIDHAKATLKESLGIIKSLKDGFEIINDLEIKLKSVKSKQKKKDISRTETDFDMYSRK